MVGFAFSGGGSDARLRRQGSPIEHPSMAGMRRGFDRLVVESESQGNTRGMMDARGRDSRVRRR